MQYQQHRAQAKENITPLIDEVDRLKNLGRTAEAERAQQELLDHLDADTLLSFITEQSAQEITALPVEEQRRTLELAVLFTFSPVEILNETVNGNRATLEVRGYDETPMMGEPGWRQGTISLVKEAGEWKVGNESWGMPGSGEGLQPTGLFEVSGAETGTAQNAEFVKVLTTIPGVWSFALEDESILLKVVFRYLPFDLQPGEYALRTPPETYSREYNTFVRDPKTLEEIPADQFDFQPSVVFQKLDDFSPAPAEEWNKQVTGTLVIEAVDEGRMSGRFEFTAGSPYDDPVNVQGSFRHVPIPEREAQY